jgi:hypothetical protein
MDRQSRRQCNNGLGSGKQQVDSYVPVMYSMQSNDPFGCYDIVQRSEKQINAVRLTKILRNLDLATGTSVDLGRTFSS